MSESGKKRGRPRTDNPLTPAERMRVYRARKHAAGLKSVSEWVPVSTENLTPYSDHRLLDARSLALHCKIAHKINKDQKLLEVPKRNLRRWAQRSPDQIPQYIKEWEQILAQPWSAIAVFITRELYTIVPKASLLAPLPVFRNRQLFNSVQVQKHVRLL